MIIILIIAGKIGVSVMSKLNKNTGSVKAQPDLSPKLPESCTLFDIASSNSYHIIDEKFLNGLLHFKVQRQTDGTILTLSKEGLKLRFTDNLDNLRELALERTIRLMARD